MGLEITLATTFSVGLMLGHSDCPMLCGGQTKVHCVINAHLCSMYLFSGKGGNGK